MGGRGNRDQRGGVGRGENRRGEFAGAVKMRGSAADGGGWWRGSWREDGWWEGGGWWRNCRGDAAGSSANGGWRQRGWRHGGPEAAAAA